MALLKYDMIASERGVITQREAHMGRSRLNSPEMMLEALSSYPLETDNE